MIASTAGAGVDPVAFWTSVLQLAERYGLAVVLLGFCVWYLYRTMNERIKYLEAEITALKTDNKEMQLYIRERNEKIDAERLDYLEPMKYMFNNLKKDPREEGET